MPDRDFVMFMSVRISQFVSLPLTGSEGADGLRFFYWAKFSAPAAVAPGILSAALGRLQRAGANDQNPLLSNNGELYSLGLDEDTLHLLGELLASPGLVTFP